MRKTVTDYRDIRWRLDGVALSELSKNAIDEAIRWQPTLTREQAGKMKVDIEVEEEYGSHSAKVNIRFERPETDDEMNKRLKNKAHWETVERRRYEELKKKFEGQDK